MSRYTDKQIFDLAANRILILDGAMGTMIQKHSLEEEGSSVSSFSKN